MDIEENKTEELLGIKVTREEFDYLICEQNKGKELKIEGDKVIAVEHIYTNEDLISQKNNAIVSKIRERYSINDELAILRQRDTKPLKFAEYNEYVEQCKIQVRGE